MNESSDVPPQDSGVVSDSTTDLETKSGSDIDSRSASVCSQYNMVCNLMEAQEGVYARGNKIEIASYFRGRVLLFLAILFSFALLISTVVLLFFTVGRFGSYVVVWFLPFFVILLLSAKFYSRHSLSSPTNIVTDPDGLFLVSHEITRQASQSLPWDRVSFVDLETYPSSSGDAPDGKTVCLVFDFSSRSFLKRLALRLQFASFLNVKELYIRDLLTNSHKLSISIPLDLFTLDSDKNRFLAGLGRWIEVDSQSEAMKELSGSEEGTTFTRLWLDDMRSSRRKRIEPLEPDISLQSGRYKVLSRLSAGGQAQIYEAYDSERDEKVVLKEFVLPVSAGADVRSRSFGNVKSEALLLACLEHPGVIKLHDHFVEDHRAYLALDFIEGKNLREIVKEEGPLAPDKVLDYAGKMAEILDYLHSRNPPVVHRDFTPDNLMVTPEDEIKLIDFNVARLMESDSTRTVVGKHSYIAPEQFKGKPATKSDLYSFGCTLYYLLTASDPVPLSNSVLPEEVSSLLQIEEQVDKQVEKPVEEAVEEPVEEPVEEDQSLCDSQKPAYAKLSRLVQELTCLKTDDRIESADAVMEIIKLE